ncbi:putative S-adenosyl-L-methionine-dependent methyltransferase [Helianthus anomalus]
MAFQFDTTLFDTIHEWNHTVVHVKNPVEGQNDPILSSESLKLTVIDSFCMTKKPPLVAAVFVPLGRENDWAFCTKAGFAKLMTKFYGISRLILVANLTEGSPKDYRFTRVRERMTERAADRIRAALSKFIPVTLRNAEYKIPFLKYNDGLVLRTNISNSTEPVSSLGNFSITEEVTKINEKFEAKKVLRFKNTGEWIHCEARIKALTRKSRKEVELHDKIDYQELDLTVDNVNLVDPTCEAMLNGLRVVSTVLEKKVRRCICLGGNGAVLASFLANQLRFVVVWVEIDNGLFEALQVAFDVKNSYCFNLDWRNIIKQEVAEPSPSSVAGKQLAMFREEFNLFDAIMIDLNEADSFSVTGQCAPPRELIQVNTLEKIKAMIEDNGVVVFHVHPPNYQFYADFLTNLIDVFQEVRKIMLAENNFVVIAIKSGGNVPLIPAPATAPSTEKKSILDSLKGLLSKAGGSSYSSTAPDATEVLKKIKEFAIEEVKKGGF